MRILIDTNIIIYREDHKVIENHIIEFHQIASKENIKILIHPASIIDIDNDKDSTRKKIIKSKINTYNQLEMPPDYNLDTEYLKSFGPIEKKNDEIDAQILYALYKDAVDFLVTEDARLSKKANRYGLEDRVFTIPEIVNFLNKEYESKTVLLPIEINYVPLHNLNIHDNFFDDLRQDYKGFDKWFTKIQREGRKGLVYQDEKKNIKAILITKVEEEPIDSDPPQPKTQRLKICTLKVEHKGYKIGEFFLKTAFSEAINKNIFEIYLTHYNQENDFLIKLINDFGFVDAGKFGDENIFIKKLLPSDNKKSKQDLLQYYYPSFYDGSDIKKFIVPIKPKYHERLFPDADVSQSQLFSRHSIFFTEGNTIKKAYICHSKIKKMGKYDIIFFYRSKDKKSITSFGIIENVYSDLSESEEIIKIVAKRTVYNLSEIRDMVNNKKVTVIIFRLYFHFEEPINLRRLMRHNILLAAPESIMEISHEKYKILKKAADINERFIID